MPSTQLHEKVKKAIRLSLPLTITTYKLPRETEEQLEEILGIYLQELSLGNYKDPLAYCMKELAVNAKKANTKRVYFEEKDLDIEDMIDYKRGMIGFKEDTLSNLEYYLNLQKEKGFYIKFTFIVAGGMLRVTIRNNVEINRTEQMRVYDRIARARAFNSLEEAFAEVLDDSEGAGLGIVILVLMLKKMGFDEDAFEIEGEGGETVASLIIPLTGERFSLLDTIVDEIVKVIDKLPQFPENITEVQRLINDPDSEIEDIARRINSDPALAADLLKTVNSAQFMLPNRVSNIPDAVMLLGFRGIKNMLYSYGTEKILNITDHESHMWDHSHRVGFYSYTLARNITKKKDVIDDAYLGGILHDIGLIVLQGVRPELVEHIRDFSVDKGLSAQLLEDMAAGYNHSEVGARIAEKWNFPPSLVDAIKYHHIPLQCRSQNKAIVYCIYLANCLANIEQGSFTFEQIEKKILDLFKIGTEARFTELMNRLSSDYEAERKL
ncbi:MAG: HDOD domain-containing protein [Spirochaetales bacterium]|nr:HDOD domain-containing protein [Spirochaetales bacterium]